VAARRLCQPKTRQTGCQALGSWMTEKLEYYDLLGTLVPGVLVVSWCAICFPQLSGIASASGLNELFGVLAGIALAVFAGQLVQTFGSLIEPLLYWSWGGAPSDRALEQGLGRYLPKDAALRIRGKLQARVASDASLHSLFLHAMQLTDAAGVGRAARFNGLYAYHRSLVVFVIVALFVALTSWRCGLLATWPWSHAAAVVVGLLALFMLAWYRAKQRAFYYVREVLLTAENVIDERSSQARQY